MSVGDGGIKNFFIKESDLPTDCLETKRSYVTKFNIKVLVIEILKFDYLLVWIMDRT